MPQRKLTDSACKNIIKDLARKLGLDAKLITTRLMSEDDKNDMRNGDLFLEALEAHITAWIASGMPDYAHGSTIPLVINKTSPKRFTEVLGDNAVNDPITIKRLIV